MPDAVSEEADLMGVTVEVEAAGDTAVYDG